MGEHLCAAPSAKGTIVCPLDCWPLDCWIVGWWGPAPAAWVAAGSSRDLCQLHLHSLLPTHSSSSFLDPCPQLSFGATPWVPQEQGSRSDHRDPEEPTSAWHGRDGWCLWHGHCTSHSEAMLAVGSGLAQVFCTLPSPTTSAGESHPAQVNS